MSATIIASVLKQDVTDRTAAAVVAANPTGTFLNNAASSVPAYLYQSLATIWGYSASSFPSYVVADLGTGQTNSNGTIVVVSDKITEQVFDMQSYFMDTPGAEIADIGILLYKPRIQTSITQIQNASLRIRYILDLTLRGVVRGNGIPGNLPISNVQTDLSIDSRYQYFIQYHDNVGPVRGAEASLAFSANYVRLFSK